VSKVYDQAYFDRWYRNPRQKVKHGDELERKARLLLGVAEYHLNRPVRSVIDIGCGEGLWRLALRKIRPGIAYIGFDSSPYAIERYGKARNLHLLPFGEMTQYTPSEPYDLLVCSDVMHYVPTAELTQGIASFAGLCEGVAFLEVFCQGDDFIGDRDGFITRSAAWYRKTFAKAGFTAAGSHCYLSRTLRQWATRLEIAE
jgi:SAM-dependent methyltransferase